MNQNEEISAMVLEEVKKYGTLLYLGVTGSKLHGTNIITSDSNYKGVYIPYLNNLMIDTYPRVINLSTSSDGVIYSDEHFIDDIIPLSSVFTKSHKLFSEEPDTELIDKIHLSICEGRYYGYRLWTK